MSIRFRLPRPLGVLLLLAWLVAVASARTRAESSVLPSRGQAAWQDLQFGVLVRFGLATYLEADTGEGEESVTLFAPDQFDALQWSRGARRAGARYLMVTVKGRDGFCLWPSRRTEYSVRAAPWRDGQGDVLREVSAACRESDLRLGLWFPLEDRHEPSAANPAAYNEFLQGQLAELLTDYGEVAELRLQAGESGSAPPLMAGVDLGGLLQLARHLQPRMVVTGIGPDARSLDAGEVVLREEEFSGQPVGSEAWWGRLFPGRDRVWRPVERLVNLRPSPFYRARENNRLLSVAQLTDDWLRSVGRNASLLLSVPAMPTGLLAEGDVRRLQELGAAIRPWSMPDLPAVAGEGEELSLSLSPPREVEGMFVAEDLLHGERVKRFLLEVREPGGDGWRVVHEGRVLGHLQMVRFNPRQVEAVRLRVLESEGHPTIRRLAVVPVPQAPQ